VEDWHGLLEEGPGEGGGRGGQMVTLTVPPKYKYPQLMLTTMESPAFAPKDPAAGKLVKCIRGTLLMDTVTELGGDPEVVTVIEYNPDVGAVN